MCQTELHESLCTITRKVKFGSHGQLSNHFRSMCVGHDLAASLAYALAWIDTRACEYSEEHIYENVVAFAQTSPGPLKLTPRKISARLIWSLACSLSAGAANTFV